MCLLKSVNYIAVATSENISSNALMFLYSFALILQYSYIYFYLLERRVVIVDYCHAAVECSCGEGTLVPVLCFRSYNWVFEVVPKLTMVNLVFLTW